MKKIDLHIHTIATNCESSFTFDIDIFKSYIQKSKIDAAAITNHNIFDIEQFQQISKTIDILILPGIEINLEGGHILLLSNIDDLTDFNTKCKLVNDEIADPNESITADKFEEIFKDLSKYILIPHFDKKPNINAQTLATLSEYITAGEVNSPKKFIYSTKNKNSLVPLYFSDIRISSDLSSYPVRQTYINCKEISFAEIKNCFRDKGKVSLSSRDGHSSFQIFEDGQELSEGINVILGERSSGKSFTLKRLYEAYPNSKYIEQFSLMERNEKKDEEEFNKLLSQKQSLVSQDYLEEFKDVVSSVISIDEGEDEQQVIEYLSSLKKNAQENEMQDAFSKAKLFREEQFQIIDLKEQGKLIASVKHLIENVENRKIIEKYVSREKLKNLAVELMNDYLQKDEDNNKREWVNSLIEDIQTRLSYRTAITPIAKVDLYQIAINRNKISKFNSVVKMLRYEREIMRKEIRGFTIVVRTRNYSGASELKTESRLKSAFSDAYKTYLVPYKYMQELKLIQGLAEADYYKYFVKVDYKILNQDGYEVSGGERSEFNLLLKINDAQQYDMLLIDEPESSFDNIFLKNEVNNIIKQISKNVPVVLVTHNSTVGASIKPNHLLCTKKEYIDGAPKYRIYAGSPTDRELVSTDGKTLRNAMVLMNCLEAGQDAYDERRRMYEDLEN